MDLFYHTVEIEIIIKKSYILFIDKESPYYCIILLVALVLH